MKATAIISQIIDGQGFYTFTPFAQTYLLEKRKITECEIEIADGRTISPTQRKHIYATLNDIAAWTGYVGEQVKAIMKYEYIAKTGADYFSLSDCNMTVAREFLTFLIEFCLENDIPTSENLLDRSPDIGRYLYACLVNKKCCLTGEKAEIHHIDAVGAGRNRKEIVHRGMRVLPLCRTKHMEIHTIGRDTFCKKYHVFGIVLVAYLCEKLKLKGYKHEIFYL
ncbi:MAG: putative HNHc nuclease [Ruthenibacterium sp.]